MAWDIMYVQKGGGYHLDLLIVAVCIIINSILGIPWFVAATVLSINHVRWGLSSSLKPLVDLFWLSVFHTSIKYVYKVV